jgi:hypothetical protein
MSISAPDWQSPGVYDIRVGKEGLKTDARKSVELQVGAVARLNFTLELGAVSRSSDLARTRGLEPPEQSLA